MVRLAVVVLLLLEACSQHNEPRPASELEVYVKIPPERTPIPWMECVNHELRRRKLNDYGDPEGTQYPDGGSPDLSGIIEEYRAIERQREDVGPLDDRLRAGLAQYSYAMRRQPEIVATCFPDGGAQ